jgi:hypothetical protein
MHIMSDNPDRGKLPDVPELVARENRRQAKEATEQAEYNRRAVLTARVNELSEEYKTGWDALALSAEAGQLERAAVELDALGDILRRLEDRLAEWWQQTAMRPHPLEGQFGLTSATLHPPHVRLSEKLQWVQDKRGIPEQLFIVCSLAIEALGGAGLDRLADSLAVAARYEHATPKWPLAPWFTFVRRRLHGNNINDVTCSPPDCRLMCEYRAANLTFSIVDPVEEVLSRLRSNPPACAEQPEPTTTREAAECAPEKEDSAAGLDGPTAVADMPRNAPATRMGQPPTDARAPRWSIPQTQESLARVYGVHRNRVPELLQSGSIPVHKVGSLWMVDLAFVPAAYLEKLSKPTGRA